MEILYYIENDTKTIEVDKDCEKIHLYPFKKIINELCIDFLSTLDGRIKAIKKKYGYKYNVPIYVNEDVLLFKVKTNNTYWININNIYKINKIKEKTEVIFFNGKILVLDKKISTIKQIIKRTRNIIKNKNDLFFK